MHLFSADPSDLRLHHSQLSEELTAVFGAAQPLESPPDAKEEIVRLQEIAREVSPASAPQDAKPLNVCAHTRELTRAPVHQMGETRCVSTPEQEALFEQQHSNFQAEQQLDKPALRDALRDALQDAETANVKAEARGPETRWSGDERVDGLALPTPGVVNTCLENTYMD